MLRVLSYILITPLVALALLWCIAAVWIDGPEYRALAGLYIASIILGTARCFGYIRPMRRALAVFAFGFAMVSAWWITIPPSSDRMWLADVEETASAKFDGNMMTVRNVRNFTYRSEFDYDPHWETREYNLADIKGLDLYLIYWGPTAIAHTILSWEFEDADGKRDHLAISIETRKEEGEEYSAVLGFFRQFELYYVVADERDLIGLRTHHRGESVYLYRLNVTPENARKILEHYFEEINALVDEPAWYNAMTHNCTTAARKHTMTVAKGAPWDWRFLFNGTLDQLGYERGSIKTGDLPFEELRKRSHITEASKASGLGADYSDVIRRDLP